MIDFQCASSCKRLEINSIAMSVFVNVLKPKLKSGFLSLKNRFFKKNATIRIQNRALTPCKQD